MITYTCYVAFRKFKKEKFSLLFSLFFFFSFRFFKIIINIHVWGINSNKSRGLHMNLLSKIRNCDAHEISKKNSKKYFFFSKNFWRPKKSSKCTWNDSYATLTHGQILHEGIFKCLTSEKISFWHENKCFVTDFRRPKTFGKMDSFYTENVLQMNYITRQNIT